MGRFLNADGYVSTGQGFTGYNMFAYCNDNPIGYCDSFGMRRVDALERTRELNEFANSTTEPANSTTKSGWTYSWSMDFTVSALDYGCSGSIALVFTEDKIGLQFSQSLPQDTSGDSSGYVWGWDVGAYFTMQYTELNSIYELEEKYQVDNCSLTNLGILTQNAGYDIDLIGWQVSAPIFGVSANYSQKTYDTTTLFTIPTFNLPKRLQNLFS